MFVILMFIILYLCFFSMYVVIRLLEYKKDIETLYDNYSKELTRINFLHKSRGVRRNA